MPGDDTRQLDWRVYSRTDRHYVKQYEAETNAHTVALVDISASMNYASQPDGVSKLDYARYLTACLLHFSRGQRDRVGLVTFDDRIRDYVPPSARNFDRTEVGAGVTEMVEAGRDLMGIDAGRNHGLGWGTVMLLKQAMERAGSTDPAAVMAQVLSGDSFEMPYGEYGFLQCGQADIRVGVVGFDADGRVMVADRGYAEADPAVVSREDLCQ